MPRSTICAVVEDQDLVGGLDGRQPVGDHDRRPPGQGRGQRLLDEQLGLRVEVGGGLVEDHHGRILEQDPGDGQPLLLPAGQPVAPLADDGVVALGQRGDQVVDAGRPAGRDDLGVGGVGPGVAQVGGDGVVEEVGVLGHHARPARPGWPGSRPARRGRRCVIEPAVTS